MTEAQLDVARKLWGWVPHSDGQRKYLLSAAKVKVAACGRRWGKSESTGIDVVLYALANQRSRQYVIAPTDDQTKIIMDEVSMRLHSIPGMRAHFREVLSPYHSIALLDATHHKNRTYMAGRTAGGKGIRGNKAHRVIMDESAEVPDDIEAKVIAPLLTDYDGDMVKIGTPIGRNHFYRDFLRGLDPDFAHYESFRHPSIENPHISADYIEKQRKERPERVFRQEYEAEFLEESGGVFRGVTAAIDPALPPECPAGPATIGVDLARIEDFTVITAIDAAGRQCYFERFNQISWERQIAAIVAVAKRFTNSMVFLDSTGVGDPIFESIRKAGVPVFGYTLTNASKESLIDNLAIEIEQQRLRLMNEGTQTNELLSYTYEITPSRNIRMNAPEGQHDDCVIALAMAAWGRRNGQHRAEFW